MFLAASLAVVASAALAAPPPSVPTGPDAEMSFDGLVKVQNSKFQAVWVKRDADFSRYKKLMVLPAEIAYKSPPTTNKFADDNFALDERQTRKLREILRDVFHDELVEKGGWQIVDAPGPDVLLVKGGLLDLIVHAPPPKQVSARGGTWVSSYGEMTLVVQLYDSQTREILARVAERREAEPPGGQNFSKVDTMASSDMRIFFRRWAKRLREGLEAAREYKPAQ
jgi:hypothetical protein